MSCSECSDRHTSPAQRHCCTCGSVGWWECWFRVVVGVEWLDSGHVAGVVLMRIWQA